MKNTATYVALFGTGCMLYLLSCVCLQWPGLWKGPTNVLGDQANLPCGTNNACTDRGTSGAVMDQIANDYESTNTGSGNGKNTRHKAGLTPAKHDPVIFSTEVDGDGNIAVTVVVRGNEASTNPASLHPMIEAHYIDLIYVKDQDGNVIAMKQISKAEAGTDIKPQFTFTLPASTSVTKLTPWSSCNLHGLWEGPAVSIPFKVRAEALKATTQADAAKKNTGEANSFNDQGGQHSPVVVEAVPNADGSVDVKVVVSGEGGATEDDKLHPMTSGHWITDIWIESDSGEVIFLIENPAPSSSNGGDTAKPILEVTLPAGHGIKSLTPYEHCNLHGK